MRDEDLNKVSVTYCIDLQETFYWRLHAWNTNNTGYKVLASPVARGSFTIFDLPGRYFLQHLVSKYI